MVVQEADVVPPPEDERSPPPAARSALRGCEGGSLVQGTGGVRPDCADDRVAFVWVPSCDRVTTAVVTELLELEERTEGVKFRAPPVRQHVRSGKVGVGGVLVFDFQVSISAINHTVSNEGARDSSLPYPSRKGGQTVTFQTGCREH